MSFSGEVKMELCAIVPDARHCQIAEIAAFVLCMEDSPERGEESGADSFLFRTEREGVARLLFTLFKRAFNIDMVVFREEPSSGGRRRMIAVHSEDPERAGDARKAISHSSILRLDCCRRAFLRGAFLAAGSVSDPAKSYHLEFVCKSRDAAEKLKRLLIKEGFDAKIVVRKKDQVVYLKEGDEIIDLLGMMGAGISFLNAENVRVLKEMRGTVNRKVNCETANLSRTAASAVRQMEDINYIRVRRGFGDLTPALRQMAEVRLANPDASLAELGAMLDPKIGKSGVNHRLRKLSAIAEDLRGNRT